MNSWGTASRSSRGSRSVLRGSTTTASWAGVRVVCKRCGVCEPSATPSRPRQRRIVSSLTPSSSASWGGGLVGRLNVLADLRGCDRIGMQTNVHCAFSAMDVATRSSMISLARNNDPILEPVYDLWINKARNAKVTNCTLVLSFRLQFFHNRRHFSNQAKERSTTHRLGITVNVCSSFRLATATVAPSIFRTAAANGCPV